MENILTLIILLIIGLGIGSFLNCFAYRLDEIETIWKGRSHCPSCRHNLAWYDLIPLLSYITLRSRCRYCRKKISIIYPFSEILTAVILVLLYLKFGLSPIFFLYSLSSFVLIIIFLHDLLTLTIADFLVYIVFVLLIIASLISISPVGNLIDKLEGAVIIAAIPTFLVLISKEKWMGRGDIQVAILVGLMVGLRLSLIALFFTFFLGGIVGIILLSSKLAKLRDKVAFAPLLIAGGWLALFWGEKALNWYLSIWLR